MDSLNGMIKEYRARLAKAMKKWGASECDDYLLELLTAIRDLYSVQIHKYLIPQETENSEKEIRGHIRDIITTILPIFDGKLAFIKKEIEDNSKKRMTQKALERNKFYMDLFSRYFTLYDDFYALVAFRSLEHFAQYMEFDVPEKSKVWKYNLNCFHGFWFYANQMVLDGKWKVIEKQLPAGYGKSFSDLVMIAFIFGVDYNADVMKVTGNPQLVGDFAGKLIKYMCNKRYSKIFPYYKQFECDAGNMFTVCQQGGVQAPARLLINGSNKGISFLMVNKETPIDGVRFNWQFYDDVTRSKDKMNVTAHEKDIAAFDDSWYKRKYSDDVRIVIGGTTYSIYDFLSNMKDRYGGKFAVASKINKYTKVCEEKKAIFVSVPKLDPDTDESTFPSKFSTEEAKDMRGRDYYTFMAMEQQEPVPVEGCLLSWDYLTTYRAIPHIEGEQECCWAVIDPARRGKNYVSMPIFVKIGNKHYLKDVIYELAIMEKVIPLIIDKIMRHHITRVAVETNTETSIKKILTSEFEKYGITYCEINGFYTFQKKEDKILNASASIKHNIVFPAFDLYAPSSPMGKFMKGVTTYTADGKNAYDDAPDTLAMYDDQFITNTKTTQKVKALRVKY